MWQNNPTSVADRARADGYFTMRECAEKADVSYATMKRYVKRGLVHPRIESSDPARGVRY